MGVWITGVWTADPGWYDSAMGEELYTVGAMLEWPCDLVGVAYPSAACGNVESPEVAWVVDAVIMVVVTGTGAGSCCVTGKVEVCGKTVDIALTPSDKGGSDTCDGVKTFVGV